MPMSDDSNNRSPRIIRNNHSTKKQLDFAAYVEKTGRSEHFLNHPEKGRLEVVTLYCNCGQSIFVEAKQAQEPSVSCTRCNSDFRWQQLTFADLNAA